MTAGAVTVVGGGIGALVAADALAAGGSPVDLFLPTRGVGGGFLPMARGERRLDLGTRVIELGYDDELSTAPPLADYRPGPHGHRPYLQIIDDLVRSLVGDDLVALPAPQVSIDRRRTTDYALGGDLTGLVEVLDPDELAAMATEARARVDIEGPHGVFVEARADERLRRTYGDVGRAHTGPLFHDRLIESIAGKILPGGTDSSIAALHRKIWLPLFHPVTAWEACIGELSYRPSRVFHGVAGGGMGEVVRRLLERIRSSSLVAVHEIGRLTGVQRQGDVVELDFGEAGHHRAVRPILGVGAEELFGAAGIAYAPDKVMATMAWLDVPDDDVTDAPTVLWSTEPDVAAFRVTENMADSRPGYRTFACELDRRRGEPDTWGDLAGDALVALGIARAGAAIDVVASASAPAFSVPSAANRDAFEGARASFGRLDLPALVVGGPTEFGVDSFNEQVVQGRAAAEILSRR